jgi:hypothetical protein
MMREVFKMAMATLDRSFEFQAIVLPLGRIAPNFEVIFPWRKSLQLKISTCSDLETKSKIANPDYFEYNKESRNG